MKQKKTRAVVIGGSIAGCLAAEVLSRHFEQVVLVEKNSVQDDCSERQSVPQENHPHVILLAGMRLLENIFPGLSEELVRKGAVSADLINDIKWFHFGQWKKRYSSDMSTQFFSRPLLDSCIRSRVLRNSKVQWLSNTTLTSIKFDQSLQVMGVDIDSPSKMKHLETRLVIDASGQGSRTAKMLENAGLGTVGKSFIETHLGYISRVYKRSSRPISDWKAMVIWPEPPHQKSIGLLLPIENDRWLLSSGGWFNCFPKAEPESLLKSLQQLPARDLYDFIKTAEPLSDVHSYRFSGSRWWHYERLPSFPDGLIVMGAALCSINPFFGQGMTLCAMQANQLSIHIGDWLSNKLSTKSIQRSFVKDLQSSWNMAKEEDMRFPETSGKRTFMIKLKHWYGAGFNRLSASDKRARKLQLKIIHLMTSPNKALQPNIASRIIWSEVFEKKHSSG
ncbi:FAD-dependent oxidoreductase [Pseudomonas chlororaphis]|uniref:FAD-dependent oxidoreductase n=1 Tax=Pseudomonas chlororaphis TaxID=587753 RepID=UPI000F558DFC|nr:FAD-dependent oxidoreductase [Pseudomonas chlororaphis]AZD48531.1 hypothetical protein C4K20_3116 [Pseudomonas chlororaphis subsp. aurantiaca]QQX57573.1 FAD-dependent oxidoreductase [Pseudomonas chlororaphis subsp. aurantiaca]